MTIICAKYAMRKTIFFAMDTINYEEAYHKALTYANASNFVIQELIFVNVHQENNKCFFLISLKKDKL